MANNYIDLPVEGGGGGGGVSSINTLIGALTLVGGTGITITPSGGNTLIIATTGSGTDVTLAPFGSAPNGNGASLAVQVLTLQPADATNPGGVSTVAQTFGGSKTFVNILNANAGIDRSTPGTLTIGATNANVINIGNSGTTVNIQGTTIYENTPQLLVTDPLITVNSGGGVGSGQNSGIEVEEAGVITGYVETSASRNSWILKAPNTAGIATITPGAGGIVLNQSSHDPVTIGTANGLSLSTQILSLALSSTSTTGALSSTDWNTFNGKQTAGNYITALTGDATATGPGSVALTLATVNGNVGTFGTATQVSTFTVNAKGLITAASNTPIQITESQVTNLVSDLAGKQATGNYITALTGDATATGPGSVALTLATVNSNVGTFGSATQTSTFTVNAKGLITAASSTPIAIPFTQVSGTVPIAQGGTGQTTKAAAFDALSPMTTGGDLIYGGASGTGTRLPNGTAGQVLTSGGTTVAPTWTTPTTGTVTSVSVVTANGLAGTSSGGATPALTLSTTITGILQGNGTAISAATTTGTGSVVLNTSPTLVTPALGTPSSVVLTNGTGLPLTTGVTGILPIANGGTNSSTALNNNRIMVSSTGSIVEAAALTNGQLLIGSTGAAPVAAAITAGTGITVTNGAGSITVATSGLVTTVTKTANYTILSTDSTIFCDTSGGAFTLTLPSPTALAGKIYRIIDITGFFQTNNLTLARSAAEKIEGLAASKVLQTNWGWFTITTNGTDWFVGG